MNDTVNTNEVEVADAVEKAVVADYLALVTAEKMDEAAAYLARFFGEGEDLDLNALGKFQEEVEAVVSAELEADGVDLSEDNTASE